MSPPGPPPPKRSPPARRSDEEDVRHGKFHGVDRPSAMLSPISPQVLPPPARPLLDPRATACRGRVRASVLKTFHNMRVQTHRAGLYSRTLIGAITKLAQSFRVEEAKKGEMTPTKTAKTCGLIQVREKRTTPEGITPT